MNKDDFKEMFWEVTTDPTSTEVCFFGNSYDEACQDWIDLVVPEGVLFTKINEWFCLGVRPYIKLFMVAFQKYEGECKDFEEIILYETERDYWFMALNADVSDCILGKRSKDQLESINVDWTEDGLLEGFADFCKAYGSEYS